MYDSIKSTSIVIDLYHSFTFYFASYLVLPSIILFASSYPHLIFKNIQKALVKALMNTLTRAILLIT